MKKLLEAITNLLVEVNSSLTKGFSKSTAVESAVIFETRTRKIIIFIDNFIETKISAWNVRKFMLVNPA